MAVNIDTVYQRVLALANKEQRGYVTPQEFNLFANQAQMEIFEQYFHDIKLQGRVVGNNAEYSDTLNLLHEKIGTFEEERPSSWMVTNMPLSGSSHITIPDEIYKIGQVRVGPNPVELLSSKDYDACKLSRLTAPTLNRPIGRIVNRGLEVSISTTEEAIPTTTGMSISFVRRPEKVEWAYVVINQKALYNGEAAVNFQLHGSEETELVYKILKLAGINLKAEQVVQVAQALETAQVQQEKQ
mgnify:CR=1 FL=1